MGMSLKLEDKKRQRRSLQVKQNTTEDEMDKLREETKKLRIDIGVKDDEILLYERKLRKAAEDLDECYKNLLDVSNKHDVMVMKLEAAEESIEMINQQNLDICEKSSKVTEENTKVGQKKKECEEKLEQVERSLCAANVKVEKLSKTVETKSIEMNLYQQEMERQLREILET